MSCAISFLASLLPQSAPFNDAGGHVEVPEVAFAAGAAAGAAARAEGFGAIGVFFEVSCAKQLQMFQLIVVASRCKLTSYSLCLFPCAHLDKPMLHAGWLEFT